MYKVLSEYSFEELAEYVSNSDYRLTSPIFESFWNLNKTKYTKLQSKILKNKIILKRTRTARRGFQRNFVIKVTKQAQGTLLEGRFAIPKDRLILGIFTYFIFISIHVFALLNLDRALPTVSTNFDKILTLLATCCFMCLIVTLFLFSGRLIYRQGEKEILDFFRTLGTEIETD